MNIIDVELRELDHFLHRVEKYVSWSDIDGMGNERIPIVIRVHIWFDM